jgi:hypothetical protein
MGYFRFQERIRILPGVRVNVSKRGLSLRLGGPGASFNIGRRGTRTTVGLPGTGLSYVEQTPYNHAPRRWVTWLWIFAIGIAVLWAIAALSETLRCSTSFQGYRVCSSPSGYRSMEWENGGRRYGDDNAGNKWTTFDGAGGEITINRRNGQ